MSLCVTEMKNNVAVYLDNLEVSDLHIQWTSGTEFYDRGIWALSVS